MDTRLASLGLHGYKTFARQTELEFPARITAIVGPNGSGKSNVADAIRWVLGEQSYSLLRAKKTEDMIYSGSEQRSRAGMAEVSIHFNNAEAWLPIDYSEVVLTRRAYRDGQNEYLINGQRVRLRDFHELLAKTGLSDRTYTIIGQGLVDQALSIKPDERRKLFEEAAGIGLYRSRKEEALRRLEATQRNLERASDIMDELRPRLRSLEKQAARVGEYKQVREDLQRNLRDWYGFHWLKSQRELERINRDLEQAKRRADEANQILLDNRTESGMLRDKVEAARVNYNHLRDELQGLSDLIRNQNQDLAILEERGRLARQNQSQLESDQGILEETVRSGERAIAASQAEVEKREQELAELAAEHETARTSLEAGRQARQKLEHQRHSLQGQVLDAEKELVSIRSHRKDLGERLEELETSMRNNTTQKAELAEKTANQKGDVSRFAEALNTLEAERKAAAAKREELVASETRLRQDRDANNQRRNQLNLAENQLRNRLDLLVQSQESLTGFSEGAKAVLGQKGRNGTRDWTDLATKLDVEEKYEAAIAVALGEAIDLLVLEDGELDRAVIEGIETSTDERVALLASRDSRKKSGLGPVPQGIIAAASELVGNAAGLKLVVDALLGHYLVVEDAAAAQKLRAAGTAYHLVTLKGELFLDNGITILGSAKGGSKVSYQRTRRDLETALAQNKTELEKLDELDKHLQNQAQALENDLNASSGKLNALQIRAENHQRELSQAQLELDKSLSQLTLLERQATDQEAALTRSKTQRDSSEVREKELSGKLAAWQEELDGLRKTLREQNLETLEQRYQYLETERKVVDQALGHARVNLQNLGLRQKADTQQLESVKQRLQETLKALGEIAESTEQLRVATEGHAQASSAMKSESLEPLALELQGMERELKLLADMESQTQQDLSLKERQLTHHQLELAREQEKTINLKNRIEDDFGLIELEYKQNYSQDTPLPFPDMVIESLPEIADLPAGIEDEIRAQKAQMRRIGVVNIEAEDEFREVQERYQSLTTQIADLNSAIADIHSLVKELDEIMHREFLSTYQAVNAEFSKMFQRLFNGGSARLVLLDESDPIEGGIEIEARLPGKREQGLVLLSGGERSLTAVALVFSLLKISPTPFCVMDEVDAMLDESNVGRFIDLLRELALETQFLLITHNRNTVQAADVIYGVTMGRDSTSQLMSLRLDEVDAEYLQEV